jgi:hypothetical protein
LSVVPLVPAAKMAQEWRTDRKPAVRVPAALALGSRCHRLHPQWKRSMEHKDKDASVDFDPALSQMTRSPVQRLIVAAVIRFRHWPTPEET